MGACSVQETIEVAIQVDPVTLGRLDREAERTGRTRSEVAAEAIDVLAAEREGRGGAWTHRGNGGEKA